ncbi:MAG: serine protease [Candidatus Omnitrophica bacterium]|nr:serine protease [Candidatus Omnitrophota bacterium]MDD5081509.1 serine protease [Candidatus Omnitrophota bacterium]MDD5441442.1 serine protease [Candidatus Omnitrophota bacterium]
MRKWYFHKFISQKTAILTILLLLPIVSVHPQPPKDNAITTLDLAFRSSVKVIVDNTLNVKGPSGLVRTPDNRLVKLDKIRTLNYRRTGVGVIATASGIIITNAHIVKDGGRIKIIFADNTETTAQPLWLNVPDDIAFLKIAKPDKFVYITFSNSNNTKTQQDIYTIGSSKFIKGQMTRGKITGIGRQKQTPKNIAMIQTSISIYKGDSGSPLFDKKGEFIGMLSAKQTNSPYYSIAIPANIIAQHLLNYMKSEKKL